MQQGDILYCKSSTPVSAIGSKKDTRTYDPWTTDINGELEFLKDPDVEPSGIAVPLFIGNATFAPQREKQKVFEFGDPVGNYTGKTKYVSGIAYAQIDTVLRGYYGSGDDIPVTARLWVKKSTVTSDITELESLADTGDSGGVTKEQLKQKLTGNTNTGTGNGNGNSNNTIWYVVGAILLSLVGFFIWKSNKK